MKVNQRTAESNKSAPPFLYKRRDRQLPASLVCEKHAPLIVAILQNQAQVPQLKYNR